MVTRAQRGATTFYERRRESFGERRIGRALAICRAQRKRTRRGVREPYGNGFREIFVCMRSVYAALHCGMLINGMPYAI